MPNYSEGVFLGTIERWGLGESKTGTPYFFLEFNIVSQASEGKWNPIAHSEKRTVFMYLSEGAMEISLRQIGELGFIGDTLDQLMLPDDRKINVQFECKHEVYDNKPREKWTVYGARRTMEHKPIEGNVIRALNAHWQKARPSARPMIPPPPSANNAPDDSSIPF